MDKNVEPLCICKTIYLPMPFFGIFIKQDIMPVEVWTRTHVTVVNKGL